MIQTLVATFLSIKNVINKKQPMVRRKGKLSRH